MKKFLVLFLVAVASFSGCKKKASNEEVHNMVIGKWSRVVSSSAEECERISWVEYKADGMVDQYDACTGVLSENIAAWRIENDDSKTYLVFKSESLSEDSYWYFRYLSKSKMTIVGVNPQPGLIENYNRR